MLSLTAYEGNTVLFWSDHTYCSCFEDITIVLYSPPDTQWMTLCYNHFVKLNRNHKSKHANDGKREGKSSEEGMLLHRGASLTSCTDHYHWTQCLWTSKHQQTLHFSEAQSQNSSCIVIKEEKYSWTRPYSHDCWYHLT